MTSFTSATTSFGSRTALISLLALSAAACSDDHPCVEYERMIDRGVYGEVVYKQDQKPDTPLYDVKVTGMSFNQPLFYEARSNEDGLYEIELAPGEYSICTEFAGIGCRSVTVSTVFRLDAIVWEGASYWEDSNFGDCN